MILWDGFCLVHTRFKTKQIEAARKKYPEAKVIVHPECSQEVMAAADASGSTSGIVKYVNEAESGATIIIGTEINLVKKLASDLPEKTIIPLIDSMCPNMAKINLSNLLESLENIGAQNVVTVPENIKKDAFLALDRMLALK